MQTILFPEILPPKAEKQTINDTRHNITRQDDYAWMRANNWQEIFHDPSKLDVKIRAHLDAENKYQTAMLGDLEALRKDLFEEMKGRIKEDDSSVPMKDGAYAYGMSFVVGAQQPRFIRTPRDGGKSEVLLDGDLLAKDKAFFKLSSADHAPNHQFLLWGADDKGSEYFSLKIRDLETQEDLIDEVTQTAGGGEWNNDCSGFFYARVDENHRPSKILFHKIGADQANDTLIYEEADPGFFMGVQSTRDQRWIMIGIQDHETSEYYIMPNDGKSFTPKLVAARETGLEYDLEEGGDIFFILTNADGAKDFKIMTAPTDAPNRENWRELIPHEPGRLILSVLGFDKFMVRLERKDGLPRIIIHERATGKEHAIFFDEDAYSLGLSGSYEYDTDIIRFTYSSMTTPAQVFDYNMVTRHKSLLKTQEVPSGHKIDDYETKRIEVSARDGENIPVTLLYRKDTIFDGSAPCLLYGYGSYGISIPASFNTNCLSLVDRGFIYAIAHIRGGKDKGYDWYLNGKRENKANTFNDFVDVAQFLNTENYTSADRLVAHGGSAGGMLMGACVNQAPDAFGAIIAEVPFVDVLTTMLDETLPLTPMEWPEWGNPVTSVDDYNNIAAYSPYDNVSALPYPPILAVAGLTDPRVTYWEPAKWVAKLREYSTSSNPVMFRINMDSGHGGASGRFSRLEEIAYTYAFALKMGGALGTSSS